MFSVQVRIFAVLAIALVIGVDQGAALSCRQCSSKDKKECLNDPGKIPASQCEADTTTTAFPDTTTTAAPDITTTAVPDTTTTAVSDTTTTAAPDTTTTAAPKMTTTTAAPKMTTTTAAPKTTTTAAPDITTTAVPDTTTTAVPDTTKTAAPKTTTTTAAPDTTTTAAPKTTKKPEDGAKEDNEDKEDSKDEKKDNTEEKKDSTDEKKGSKKDDTAKEGSPHVDQVLTRSRRGAIFMRATESACYKLVYKEAGQDVVERGCAKSDACNDLKEGKADAKCYFCTKDGCNGSSQVALGTISILLPAFLIFAIFRQ